MNVTLLFCYYIPGGLPRPELYTLGLPIVDNTKCEAEGVSNKLIHIHPLIIFKFLNLLLGDSLLSLKNIKIVL